jgi:uracil phosphoribosyltransferase
LVLGIETSRTRLPVGRDLAHRFGGDSDLGAGGDHDRLGRPVAVDQHVAAARDRRHLRRAARLMRHGLAREHEARRAVAILDRRAHATAVSTRIAGRHTSMCGMMRAGSQVLDRLVRRTVLAEADRVVRIDEDHAERISAGHAHRVARVVRERQERRRRRE